jgi:hypothetical protein
MRPVRARAVLLGSTMIAYAAVISYLRRQQRRKDRPRCGAKTARAGAVWSESSSGRRAAASTVDCRRARKLRPVAPGLRERSVGAGAFIEKDIKECRKLV